MTTTLGAEFRSLRDAAVLLSVAIALGLLALTGPVTSLDYRLGTAVSSMHTSRLTDLFTLIGNAASPMAVLLVAVGVVVMLLAGRRGGDAVWLLSVILGGWALSWIFGELFHRPGPAQSPSAADVADCSYPSTHVALTMGCALAAYGLAGHSRLRPLIVAAGTVAVSLVSLAVVYLGQHYFTDLVGAVLVSTAVTTLLEAWCPESHHLGGLTSWPQP